MGDSNTLNASATVLSAEPVLYAVRFLNSVSGLRVENTAGIEAPALERALWETLTQDCWDKVERNGFGSFAWIERHAMGRVVIVLAYEWRPWGVVESGAPHRPVPRLGGP